MSGLKINPVIFIKKAAAKTGGSFFMLNQSPLLPSVTGVLFKVIVS